MTISASTANTRISEIDAILAAGVKTVSKGDRTVVYDFEALRRERARLMRIVASSTTSPFRRVTMNSNG